MLARLERATGGTSKAATNRSRAIRKAIEEHVVRLEREADASREAAIIRRHRDRLAREARALIGGQAKS
ncbi:MAG: hypothetical protein ACRD2N_07960 [Vicinamibacterales bacterium]